MEKKSYPILSAALFETKQTSLKYNNVPGLTDKYTNLYLGLKRKKN